MTRSSGVPGLSEGGINDNLMLSKGNLKPCLGDDVILKDRGLLAF